MEHHTEREDARRINLEGYERKMMLPVLRYSISICLERLGKTMEVLVDCKGF
jgi:hypothetical protein